MFRDNLSIGASAKRLSNVDDDVEVDVDDDAEVDVDDDVEVDVDGDEQIFSNWRLPFHPNFKAANLPFKRIETIKLLRLIINNITLG